MARIGRQTPTKSVMLEYTKTKGNEAIKTYALSGNKLIEWQQNLIKSIMAVNDDGKWLHIQFGFSVPRRNGKTEDIYAREMWGLLKGENILHTAHRTDTAHASWDSMNMLLKKAGIPIKSSYRAVGKEHIYIKGGGKIEYRTRSNSGALGRGYDLLIIDEAQEYTNAQSTALTYVTSASSNPQTIFLGTPPTEVSAGTKFLEYRESVLAGKKEDCGWAEWSIGKKTDPYDKDSWYETNPSLGIILSERTVKSEISKDDVDFNIQRLGLWILYNLKSEITEVEWSNLIPKKMPNLTSKLFVGIKYGKGENVSLSIAARTDTDSIFVEAIDCRSIRSGDQWILKFLMDADIEKIVIDGASGQNILKKEIKDNRIRPLPILPQVNEVISANSIFLQAIDSQKICHMNQKSLSQVVTNCKKRAIGSRGGFGFDTYLDGADITLMDSAILAYWSCCTTKKQKSKQKASY